MYEILRVRHGKKEKERKEKKNHPLSLSPSPSLSPLSSFSVTQLGADCHTERNYVK